MRDTVIHCARFVSVALALATATAAQATLYEAYVPFDSYGHLCQLDVPVFGEYACGPSSITNSMTYLENQHPSIYGSSLVPPEGQDLDGDGTVDFYDDMIATVTTLGSPDYMDTIALGGTPRDSLMWGTEQYIEQRSPGVTSYSGQTVSSWPYHDKPEWCDETVPSWEFLYEGMLNEEALTFLIITPTFGHYLSLTGFYFDDANDSGIMDYKEDAWIEYVDPWTGEFGASEIWHKYGEIEGMYGPNLFTMTMAFSMSPIPGPSALAVIAVAVMMTRRRRR